MGWKPCFTEWFVFLYSLMKRLDFKKNPRGKSVKSVDKCEKCRNDFAL